MRLENLYTNFGESSSESQAAYVADYRARRAEDMLKTPTWPKPKKLSKKRVAALPLTPEEEQVMKLMGLKKKDVIEMRTMKNN